MTTSTTPYPLHVLRAVALHAQRLATPNGAEPAPTPDAIYDTVDALGCVQIDTLHMVARSHYLALWSRLGAYRPADFDGLLFKDGERRLFEYWGHAASVIPLKDYRYYLPTMQRHLNAPSTWWERWTTDNTNRATLEEVRRRLAEEGALRAADFEYNGRKRESWWDWKPAKHALEYLFAAGEVMIANRVNFQRVYDLTGRVLPGWVDTTVPTQDEARRHFVEQAGRRLGVFEPMQAVDYAYLKRGVGRKHAEALVKDGTFVEIGGEQHDGSATALYAHRDTLPLLEQAAQGALRAERTTFLSPFDSLFWAAGRDVSLWGFKQVLECYKRAPDRIWGYFCLPILHRDRLVGRFDPKLDRKAKVLTLRALYLEPGVKPEAELVDGVAAAMRDFLTFHKANDLVVEKSDPPTFGKKLLKAL